VRGRLLTEASVPPRAAPAAHPAVAPAQAAGATRLPAPAALPADTSAQAPSMPSKPELRRLGPNAVAFRVSPQARWVIIRSESPLELSRADSLPAFEAQPDEAAYAPGHGTQSSATATH
jgi:hypothetical protein